MRHPLVTPAGLLVAAILVSALPASVAQGQEARTVETLSARLKMLEDKEAIGDVLVAYGRALDSRDFKTYASLFSKDGSWSGGLGKVTGGPQAIYDFMTARIGGGPNAAARPIGFGSTYHIMSSFDIKVTGDTATALSRWAFVTAARGPGVQVAGRYEDTFVRENGAWKIRSRQAFNDLTAPAAPAAATAPAAPAAQAGAGPAFASKVLADNDQVRIQRLTVPAGFTETMQVVPNALIAIQVTPADLEVMINGQKTAGRIEPGTTFYVPKNAPHQFLNKGQNAYDVVVVTLK